MSTDAQTQAIPRVRAAALPGVSAAVIAAADAETAAPAPDTETAAPGRDTEFAAPQPAENAVSAPDAVVAAAGSDAVVAAAGSDAEVAGEEPVQLVYEAAMARLNALHDRWAAAMVELRESQVDSGGEAAA